MRDAGGGRGLQLVIVKPGRPGMDNIHLILLKQSCIIIILRGVEIREAGAAVGSGIQTVHGTRL